MDRAWRAALFVGWRLVGLWFFVARPRARRGVCVAVWWGGRLLAVEHSYKRGLGLPGGGLRRGEAPDAAAARELAEEVGIAVAPAALEPLFELPCEWRYVTETVHYFALRPDAEPSPRPDGREILRAFFHSPDELEAADLLPPTRNFLREWRRRSGAR
jgi:8-oxo-dGTP pyrophosphatase MutT (NUDIX family)